LIDEEVEAESFSDSIGPSFLSAISAISAVNPIEVSRG
jgi:hypothetical protein